MSTANMLCMRIFQSFISKPVGNLKIRDHYSIGSFGYRDTVTDVVTMSMSDQNKICFDIVRLFL